MHSLYGGGVISDIWAGAVAAGSIGGFALLDEKTMMAVTAAHCFTSKAEDKYESTNVSY